MPHSDNEWEARNDMSTLVEAEKIKSDPGRLARAKGAAAKVLKETDAIVGAGSENVASLAGGFRKL